MAVKQDFLSISVWPPDKSIIWFCESHGLLLWRFYGVCVCVFFFLCWVWPKYL